MAHCDDIIRVNDKELKPKVATNEDEDLAEVRFEVLADMQHPRVCKVTAKEDLRDTVEEQEVPTDGVKELIPQISTDGDGKVPECTNNKIDEARSNDDTRKIKNCYEYESFGFLDCNKKMSLNSRH